MNTTFMSGNTPPARPSCVLVYYVYAPHLIPEWGYDLAFYKDGKWFCWWDNELLDYDVLYWSIVDVPLIDPKSFWFNVQP